MWVEIEIANIGNDPAIEILVDGEIELEYASINGENIIPARFSPSQKSFLMAGKKILDESINLSFGNKFIKYFFESSKEMSKLNQERIRNTPWKDAYQTAKLTIYVYYSNNMGQYFKSEYSIYICLDGKIPRNNEIAKIQKVFIPRPTFSNKIIKKEKVEEEIAQRDLKRNLCGW